HPSGDRLESRRHQEVLHEGPRRNAGPLRHARGPLHDRRARRGRISGPRNVDDGELSARRVRHPLDCAPRIPATQARRHRAREVSLRLPRRRLSPAPMFVSWLFTLAVLGLSSALLYALSRSDRVRAKPLAIALAAVSLAGLAIFASDLA